MMSPGDGHLSGPKQVVNKVHEIKHVLIFVANEVVLKLNSQIDDLERIWK
jgi:hypothetical protein